MKTSLGGSEIRVKILSKLFCQIIFLVKQNIFRKLYKL